MSTAANVLTELPTRKQSNSPMTSKDNSPENVITDLSKLGPKATITVNKVDNTKPLDDKEFMEDADSEFGPASNKMANTATSPIINIPPAANNTTTITVSTSDAGNNKSPSTNINMAKSGNDKMSNKISDIKDSDAVDETLPAIGSTKSITSGLTDKSSNEKNDENAMNKIAVDDKNNTKESAAVEPDEEDEDEVEQSAAELVATAAAQIANKTLKKSTPTTGIKLGSKTIKTTGKLLASGKQEQIMKKAMLMMNESGRLNVITDEPTPSIVKLNTPANKAQIKLRAFRQNFERQYAEMRRKTPLQIQTLVAELANIEFAEIGNKNIMTGLLELVDDHELKLLTIEKMLKSGDITLSF